MFNDPGGKDFLKHQWPGENALWENEKTVVAPFKTRNQNFQFLTPLEKLLLKNQHFLLFPQ